MNYQSFLLEINLGIILFFSFYKAFISKDTLFKINRIYLLSGIFLSILISLPLFQNTISSNTIMVDNILNPVLITAKSLNYTFELNNSGTSDFFKIVYLTGILFFTFSFIYKIYYLLLLYKKGDSVQYNNYTLIKINKNISPFSFFHFIFIYNSGLNKNEMEKIITHELIHVNQKHSIDLLIIEWLCIFLWFNPFIWFYKKAIKENHEYIADESTLQSGISFEGYRKLILSQIFGISVATVSNNFVKSLTKKRFKMMTKKKSNTKVKLKTILILPAISVFFTLLTFSINSCTNNTNNKSIAKNDTVYNKVDEMPVFQGGIQRLQQFIAENVVYPEPAKKLNIEGKVFVQFVIDKNGKVSDAIILKSASENYDKQTENTDNSAKYDAALALDKEALRVIKSLPDWQPGKKNNETVKVQYTIPINFRLN